MKSTKILLFSVRFNAVDGDLNGNKIVVLLFGAAYTAPNISTKFLF